MTKSIVYQNVEYPLIDPELPVDSSIDPTHFRSIDEVQQWITRRSNWHESTLFVVKWSSKLVPKVRRQEGRHICEHPYDTGLAESILWLQREDRVRPGSIEETIEPAQIVEDE